MTLYSLDGFTPELPPDGDCWIAPDANLIGKVVIGNGASVWFGCTLRGDNELILFEANAMSIRLECFYFSLQQFYDYVTLFVWPFDTRYNSHFVNRRDVQTVYKEVALKPGYPYVHDDKQS